MNGNRTSVKVDGVTTQALTFKAGNQIPTAGYGFDTAGQQTTASGAGTLGYNGAGQMTTATKAGAATSYAYAGPGQDELLTVNPIGADRYDVYGRAGDHGVPVIDSVAKNGAVSYRGNDPGGTPLAIHLSGRQADYYVLDGNGSVVALVDGPGTGNGTYSYDPNGAQTRPTGSGTVVDLTPYRPHHRHPGPRDRADQARHPLERHRHRPLDHHRPHHPPERPQQRQPLHLRRRQPHQQHRRHRPV